MKLHHFITPIDLGKEHVMVLDAKLIHHVVDVLKLVVGEKIVIADGAGNEALIRISSLNKDSLEGIVLERNVAPPPSTPLRLVAALLKRDSYEFVVQKATELGVGIISPLITERTVKLGFNRARLERIIVEASEQSEQSVVPTLEEPQTFAEAMAAIGGKKYFFAQIGIPITEIPRLKISEPTSIWIGPEGGWTPEEIEKADTHGAHILNLGSSILRAETAATVATFWAKQFLMP